METVHFLYTTDNPNFVLFGLLYSQIRTNGLLRISVFIMKRRPSQQCLLVVSGFGSYRLWVRIWDMDGGVVAAYEREQSRLPPSNGATISLQELKSKLNLK